MASKDSPNSLTSSFFHLVSFDKSAVDESLPACAHLTMRSMMSLDRRILAPKSRTSACGNLRGAALARHSKRAVFSSRLTLVIVKFLMVDF